MMNQWWPLLLPALPLLMVCYNLLTWRRGAATQVKVKGVSILIPARNEQHRLSATLEAALLAGTANCPIHEIIVCSDNSSDDTEALVRQFSARDPRIKLLIGKPLPNGWIGKSHACEQLLQAAHSQHLLFVDADVQLQPGALQTFCSLVDAQPFADLITAVPRQITHTFGERFILPLLHLTYLAWLPLRLSEKSQNPRFVAANGQLIFCKKRTLLELGGFATIRCELVDDVALCRAAKSRGLRVLFMDGHQLANCRMYQNAREVVTGFSKNIYEGLGSPVVLLAVFSLYIATFVSPYFLLILSSLFKTWEPLFWGSLGAVVMNVALRGLLAYRYRQAWEGIFLHPLSVIGLLLIALNSFYWSTRNNIRWSGRNYLSMAQRKAMR